jgi:hypothetical protein
MNAVHFLMQAALVWPLSCAAILDKLNGQFWATAISRPLQDKWDLSYGIICNKWAPNLIRPHAQGPFSEFLLYF